MPDITVDADVYVIYGEYVDVEDLDGSLVNIEQTYDSPRYSYTLEAGQRGAVLAAAGDAVSDVVAAALDV